MTPREVTITVVPTPPNKRLEIEGPLLVSETDGGFLPDRIEIDGVDITNWIAQLYDLRVSRRGWGFDTAGSPGLRDRLNPSNDVYDLGMVRLIIEQLEPSQ